MLCLVPLLIVFVAPPCIPSPVVYIINKMGFLPPTLVSSGIVVTDTYIITSNYPVSSVVVSQVCVMPATDLLTVDKIHIRKFCKDIKKINSLSNVTLLELTQALIFTHKVNVAAIPAVKTLNDSLDLTKNCQLVINYRNTRDSPVVSHGVVAAIFKESNFIKLYEEKRICTGDSGLPFYCENAVVGIMLFPEATEMCCSSMCTDVVDIPMVNLSNGEIQDLLRKKIGNSSG